MRRTSGPWGQVDIVIPLTPPVLTGKRPRRWVGLALRNSLLGTRLWQRRASRAAKSQSQETLQNGTPAVIVKQTLMACVAVGNKCWTPGAARHGPESVPLGTPCISPVARSASSARGWPRGSEDAGQEILHQLEGTLAAQWAAWPPAPPPPEGPGATGYLGPTRRMCSPE